MSIIETAEEFRPPFLSPKNRTRLLADIANGKPAAVIFADLSNEIAGDQEAILKRERDRLCQNGIAVLTVRDDIVTPLCGAAGGGNAKALRAELGINDIRFFALLLIGPDGETLVRSATPLKAEDILAAVGSARDQARADVSREI